jgi:hypothetical protein
VTRLLVDGRADVTFGEGGTVTTDFRGGSDALTTMDLQRDSFGDYGTLLAGGTSSGGAGSDSSSRRFAVARYRFDGSLDPTSGPAGPSRPT